jgi:hypothetical protein
VTVKSVLSLDFSGSGKSKSFFCTGVRLNFRHLTFVLLIIKYMETHYTYGVTHFQSSISLSPS